ncbi:hypothetical protein DFH07DRAFT_772009 [Mycena maculata]|uniref:Uncharacterized protein n=1 Tax=Mycena maculata TaxID=230809 RepID=A0AAD7JC75_9AGAR|nr:hypothetical protein DFH07DRAFT_772009 [Mycena maculata]
MTEQAEGHQLKSEYAEARRIHLQIAQDTSADQDLYTHALSLMNIAQIDVMIGQHKQDVHHNLDRAKALWSSVEYFDGVCFCEAVLADLHLREEQTVSAKVIFHRCLQSFWVPDVEATSYCLERMADTSRWGPLDFHWTSRFTVIYLALAKKIENKLALHKALPCLGDVFLTNRDEVTARNLFSVALEGFTHMDVHRDRAECMLRLGDLAKNQGDLAMAKRFWTEAQPLFERSLQAKYVTQCDTRLTNIP